MHKRQKSNYKLLHLGIVLIPCMAALAVFTGCEIDSAESSTRLVTVNVAGLYRNTDNSNNGHLVATNSGAAIIQIDLRQTGDQLEAVDNNGVIFRGTIGSVDGDSPWTVSYTLKGTTTIGAEGTMSGTFEVDGSSSVMRGTWIEPSLYSTIYGQATVAPSPTNQPSENLAISPSGNISMNVQAGQSFTASGGSGSYSWSLSNNSIGEISTTTGLSTKYTATATGTQTISVSDGSKTESTTISQN